MAKNEVNNIAQVYAQALIDLATGEGAVESIEQQFAEFCAYLKIDPEFRELFESRVVDRDARRQSLDRLFQGRISDLLLNFLQILNQKGRTSLVRHIQLQYHQLYLQHVGIIEVQITSADALSDGRRSEIQKILEQKTGKQVSMIENVDPAVLGGVVVRWGDQKIDLSVARQLDRVYDQMLEEISQKIFQGTNQFISE